MATQQGDDIQELKLDVGLIKGDIRTIKRDMSTNQKTILDRMDKFAFVTQKDHDKDMADIRKDIIDATTNLQAQITLLKANQEADHTEITKGGLKIANILTNSVFKIIMGALGVGVVILIVYSLIKVAPAIYGGQL